MYGGRGRSVRTKKGTIALFTPLACLTPPVRSMMSRSERPRGRSARNPTHPVYSWIAPKGGGRLRQRPLESYRFVGELVIRGGYGVREAIGLAFQ